MGAAHPRPFGYWKMFDVLDFIQRARDVGMTISMSPGSCPFSVMDSNGNYAFVVRFWWNGRVDCLKGTIPDLGSPGWLDEGNAKEWYEFLGVTP